MSRLVTGLECEEHGNPLPTRMEVRGGGQIAVCLWCGYKTALWECPCEMGHDCEGAE